VTGPEAEEGIKSNYTSESPSFMGTARYDGQTKNMGNEKRKELSHYGASSVSKKGTSPLKMRKKRRRRRRAKKILEE